MIIVLVSKSIDLQAKLKKRTRVPRPHRSNGRPYNAYYTIHNYTGLSGIHEGRRSNINVDISMNI